VMLLRIRDKAAKLVNDSTVSVWGQDDIVYTDTAGKVDALEAVFDEAYQMVDTGENGAVITMTAPVLSCRLADFVNSTPQCDGQVTIGTRFFVVNSVERTGHLDCRLILSERM